MLTGPHAADKHPLILLGALVLAACAPPAPVHPSSGAATLATTATAAPKADPFALPGSLEHEQLPAAAPSYPMVARKLPPLPKGLPPSPRQCYSFATRTAGAAPSCAERAAAHTALDAALSQTDPASRDGALAALEACRGLPAGVARALRAELAPPQCADALTAPLLAKPPAGISGPVYDALFGLALAGRLARAAKAPPALAPPYTKKSVRAYVDGPMGAWVNEQAVAIEQLARLGASLRYYGKAVAAVEAGLADLRFIDAARLVPVPDEIARFADATEKYYQNLELSLQPRKDRGRDATLVGLGQLAQIGVLRGRRAKRARAVLSRMYGGSPIDVLDGLRLAPLPAASAQHPTERLAARLPTFYAGLLIAPARATEPVMLRMLIERGVALPHRIALSHAELSATQRALYGRARLELAQNYWRRVDVDEAVALLAARPGDATPPLANRLALAVGLALRGGPANAAEMMVRAPVAEIGIGDVTALDAITDRRGPLAALAALDAALIRQLAAPATAKASYWHNVAARFRRAASLMKDVTSRADAEQRAGEAEQTAAAIERGGE